MLHALYIFVDDDFNDPIYGEPALDEVDADLWEQLCEAVNDALEGDGALEGVGEHDGVLYAWKTNPRNGLSFVMAAEDVVAADADTYLTRLVAMYMDEVDNPRSPERDGVYDVVVEVIPPWEE